MMFYDDICFKEVSDLYPFCEAADEDNQHLLRILTRLGRILPNLKIEYDIFHKENGPRIVRNVMNHFNSWKEKIQGGNQPADYVGVKHLAALSMAKLCFYYWITDSSIVSQVLFHVYDCDENLSSFFTHIVNQDNRLMWPSCIPQSKQKETLTMMYFLNHAHNSKMEFLNIRFVDMKILTPLQVPPTYLACIYAKPQLLLLTLRYGADIERRSYRDSDDWDINMLLRHLIRTVWSEMGPEYLSTDRNTTVISASLSDVLECLNILLRAIEQIKQGKLDFELESNIQGIPARKKSHEFITWLSATGVVPYFASRYREPCELKHLCRLVIRKILNESWNLPHGISSLLLPKYLHEYINVTKD